jgi:DNA polymerase (family 10)
MDKFAIAAILEEMGSMLEMKGENPFKSRAYHNASRVVAGLSDIQALVRDKTLCDVKGLGKTMCGHIETLLATGRDPFYEELQKNFPAGLLELIRVQGVGPKRALILYKKLNIKDVVGLEKAAKEGKISKLEGFGEKSQEKILKGLEFLGKHAELHHFDQAYAMAQTAVEELQNHPAVQRISVCGSLRRRREIIRDIDILVSSKNAKAVIERFVKLPNVVQILSEGDTKSSVLTFEGYQMDLRVVSDAEFPFALHYFTGSKEHNIAVRHLANMKGLTLNEYGLFKTPKTSSPAAVSGGTMDPRLRHSGMTSIKCKDESELFGKLGLAYIPPEMREDRGEIDAALKNKIPKLIEPEDIKGVFHVHSTWSDGKASLEDMIAEAQRLGWEYVGISDHSKTAAYAHGLEVERVKQQAKEIEKLRGKYKIRIFWGSECDILRDGTMDYADSILANYDFVIASVHSLFNLPEAEQTQRICQALKNKYVTILGHITGRLLLSREGYAVDQTEVLNAAAAEGVAVELNAQPHRFDIDWRMLPAAREKGVKISINPDAHSVKQLSLVPFGVGIGRKGWLTKDDVINTMPLKQITQYLAKRRS